MKSNTTRVIAGIAVVVIAVVLLIVLKDDGKSDMEKTEDSSSSAPAKSDQTSTGQEKGQGKPSIPTIVIKNGKPVGGIAELTYNAGDQIRFRVDSDISEEIHVHGYDLMKDVKAGGSVTFDFPASIEGIFEAELEGRGEQIAELTVNP